MIDLNSLTLYKNKISSYVDENALTFPTTSNILGMFKIKNYTGKGITKNGNVKIDEKGIATNFINTTDYVVTNLDVTDLKLPFEVQVKFKVSDKTEFNRLCLITSKTNGYPFFELLILNGKIMCNSYKTAQSGNGNTLFYDSFDFDADKWYIINIKHEQKGIYECTVYDEKYNELYNKTQNSGHEVTNQSDVLILGNDIDYVSGNATLQIDLSETYFKNGDTIISEWNLWLKKSLKVSEILTKIRVQIKSPLKSIT